MLYTIMYFDALTLAAVADELRATILGGRIQRVLLPGSLSIYLEVYAHRQRYHLLASAHPQMARVHLLQKRPSRGMEQATPLLLLLRKYVLGGRIVRLEQPPLERLLVLSIVKDTGTRNQDEQTAADALDTAASPMTMEAAAAVEDAPENSEVPLHAEADGEEDEPGRWLRSELIIEPMERRSNILLVDDANLVLESVKRVTPRMSQRVVLPRQPYELPPAQEKRDPRTATAQGILALDDTGTTTLVKALVAAYRGVSPQVAREVAQRALGNSQARLDALVAHDGERRADMVAAGLRALYMQPFEPSLVAGVASEAGQPAPPHAYAPYLITHLSGALPQPSMSVALEAYYAAREALTDHRQRRDTVQRTLDSARERLQHQYRQISEELAHTRDGEHVRWEGEMIFAFLHALQPGQTSLEVEGRTIALDPDKSPTENAQQRFRMYQKARSGRERLQEREQTTANQLAALEQLATLLEVATERDQIDQIALEAEEQGLVPASAHSPKQQKQQQTARKRLARRKPLRLVSSDGFDVYVGRSASQNAEVTFKIGRPDDLWLHVRAIPGAHVIIRSGGREVPERTLHEAAGVAAFFSRARAEPLVDVELSRRRQVRKVPGGAPGLVTYRAEQTIRVPPLPPWG